MNPSPMDWILLVCIFGLLIMVVGLGQAVRQLQLISDVQDHLNDAFNRDITKLEKGKNWIPPEVSQSEARSSLTDEGFLTSPGKRR